MVKLRSKVFKEVLTSENKSILVIKGDILELVEYDVNKTNCLVKFINDENFTIQLGLFYMSIEEVDYL